jgi:hypothetical protein
MGGALLLSVKRGTGKKKGGTEKEKPARGPAAVSFSMAVAIAAAAVWR